MAPRQSLGDVAAALNSSAIHLLRGLKDADRASGLTPARLSALSVVVFGAPTSIGRLASIEDVASPTMTRIVDGLETLGLVRRTRHPENGRIALVEPTAEGVRLMERAAARRRVAIIDALRRLPTDERAAITRAAGPLRRLPSLLPRKAP